MNYCRTAFGAEMDLILGDGDAAIEIKSSERAGDRTRGLHLFSEENACKQRLVISRDPLPRKPASGITVLPWQVFCEMLWSGRIF